ncbi:MAG: dienelactone hydrolase family protein, partial [Acidimicrobiia bacterium]
GRPDCEVVVYEGADHGFVHDAERPAHRAADAADAWTRVLAQLGVEEPADESSPAGSGLV